MWYNEPMKHIIQFTVTKDEGVYTCACRKSNPDILVMQSVQDRTAKNVVCTENPIDPFCDATHCLLPKPKIEGTIDGESDASSFRG